MQTLSSVVLAALFGGVACGGATELTCGEDTVARDGECIVDEAAIAEGGSEGSLRCGAGTVERNGECVVAKPPNTSGSAGTPATGGSGGTAGSTGAGTSGSTAEGGGPSAVDLPPGATADEVAKAQEYCEQAESGVIAMPDGAMVQQRLVGRWLLCEGSVLFGRNDTAGIRFESNGTWSFMLQGEADELVDGQGFDDTGGWNVLDTGQTNLDRAGGGGDGIFLSFATTPPKVRFSSMIGMSTYASLDH
jgi:hypothetical protein